MGRVLAQGCAHDFRRGTTIPAWPVAAAWAAWLFKKPLGSFMDRLYEVGLGGAKASQPQTATPIGHEISAEIVVNARNRKGGLVLPDAPEAIAAVERNIEETLRQNNTDGLTPADQQKLFVREYALLQVRSHFKIVAYQIYGTQFTLLRQLDEGPKSKASIMTLFRKHSRKCPENARPDFPNWINFLMNTELVATNSDGNYIITALGRFFSHEFAPNVPITQQNRLY